MLQTLEQDEEMNLAAKVQRGMSKMDIYNELAKEVEEVEPQAKKIKEV